MNEKGDREVAFFVADVAEQKKSGLSAALFI
jgi:hypothetical protein